MSSNIGRHLTDHFKSCGCEPILDNTSFEGEQQKKTKREIIEAVFIRRTGNKCVSTPFLTLGNKETLS